MAKTARYRRTSRPARWLWTTAGVIALVAVVATMAATRSVDDGGPPPDDGSPSRPQIVGGHSARPGEFPFAVGLLRHGKADAFDAHFCGGSLIGPDLVLTAAHCVAGDDAARVDVLVGTHDLSAGGQRIPAERLHVHPAYDPVSRGNDVAVVELAAFAEPAALVGVADGSDTAAWPAGSEATVVGWGTTKTDGYPTVLRAVDVPIVSDDECRASYGREIIEGVMVCAGDEAGGRDACTGDSGGPLFVPDRTGPLVVGVVSWGYGCALPGLPGVYAEVAALGDFLEPFLDGFRDLPRWASEAITWITTNHYAEGFPDRRFRPDDPMTRAQAVQILHRIVDPPADVAISPTHPFTDVPAWLDHAVRWAVTDPDGDGPAASPLSGYPDGTFRPDRPVTRGELTRLLWRLHASPVSPPHDLSDVGAWLDGAVSWITAEGVATGWPDATFRPGLPVTRAQASRMLYRLDTASPPVIG